MAGAGIEVTHELIAKKEMAGNCLFNSVKRRIKDGLPIKMKWIKLGKFTCILRLIITSRLSDDLKNKLRKIPILPHFYNELGDLRIDFSPKVRGWSIWYEGIEHIYRIRSQEEIDKIIKYRKL